MYELWDNARMKIEFKQDEDFIRKARKLAVFVDAYCTHKNQDKYGDIEFLAEKIAPLAAKVKDYYKKHP